MTAKEFLVNALLRIAGSGVFGKPNFHTRKEWASDIKSAAFDLLESAKESGCIEDEADKPP